MKMSYIIHPFLFAIYPVLFLFSQNIEQVSFLETLYPFAIILGCTFLLILTSRLILNDNNKAGIIVTIFLIIFFFYGYVFEVIQGWHISLFMIKCIMLAWGMIFPFCAYFIIRTRRDLHNFTNILNSIAIFLIVFSFVNIGIYFLRERRNRYKTSHIHIKMVVAFFFINKLTR